MHPTKYIAFQIVFIGIALFIARETELSKGYIVVMLTLAAIAGYYVGKVFPKFWGELTKPK